MTTTALLDRLRIRITDMLSANKREQRTIDQTQRLLEHPSVGTWGRWASRTLEAMDARDLVDEEAGAARLALTQVRRTGHEPYYTLKGYVARLGLAEFPPGE